MKRFKNTGPLFVNLVVYLYILLFVYAAVSKLLDFSNFKIQLGQSPIINVFAAWLVWFIPLIEIFIGLLLISKKTKFWALYAAYFLMLLFTAYIYIMMSHSPFLPCSCGGILENLGWKEHLVFNIVFVLLAAHGLYLMNEQKLSSTIKSKP